MKNLRKHIASITILLVFFCTVHAEDFFAQIEPISERIAQIIVGKTWQPDCPIPLKDLRYITIAHWGYDDTIHRGEIIVHKDVAEEIVEIFHELFAHKFAIEKMQLIDNYFQDNLSNDEIDGQSLAENNSSAFFFRYIGKTTIVSEHGLGTALDINPRINPFVRGKEVYPADAQEFCDRSRIDVPGMITRDSICYQAFIKRDWKWGGNWKNVQDYQHFCKQEIIPENFNA